MVPNIAETASAFADCADDKEKINMAEIFFQKATEQFADTGLPDLIEVLSSADGKAFKKATRVMNVGRKKRPGKTEINEALELYVAFFAE
eukprot:2133551-Heterocapsa_arctica.AAC.1